VKTNRPPSLGRARLHRRALPSAFDYKAEILLRLGRRPEAERRGPVFWSSSTRVEAPIRGFVSCGRSRIRTTNGACERWSPAITPAALLHAILGGRARFPRRVTKRTFNDGYQRLRRAHTTRNYLNSLSKLADRGRLRRPP